MNIRFQIFIIVGLLVFSLSSCSQSKTPNNSWTIISINENEAYFYKGELKEKSQIERINLSDSLLIDRLAKEVVLLNQKKDSVILILKPTQEGKEWYYLERIAKKISLDDRYGFVVLTELEKKWFGLHDYNFTPPEPVVVTTPGSVISQKLPDSNAILIELKNDGSVWYKILSPETLDSSLTKIEKPVTNNLKQIISNYEKINSEVKKDYLIKGDNDVNNKAFAEILEALKQNNIFKYKLVTAVSQ